MTEEYTKKVIASTIQTLTDTRFEYLKQLGDGSYGLVIEIKNPYLDKTYAAKIILEEDVTEGEMLHLASLRHENILPLLASKHIRSTYSYVFLMLKYSFT